MANINLIGRVANLTKTKDEWSNLNPVLLKGEIGYESDTNKCKFGDGTTAWNSLTYTAGGSAEGGFSIRELETQLTVITSSGTTTTDCTTLQDRLYATHVKNLREAFRTAVAAGEITALTNNEISSFEAILKYLPVNAIYSFKGHLFLYNVPSVYQGEPMPYSMNSEVIYTLSYHNIWTLLTRLDTTTFKDEDVGFLYSLEALGGNFSRVATVNIASSSLSVKNTVPVLEALVTPDKVSVITQTYENSEVVYAETVIIYEDDVYYQLVGNFRADFDGTHYTLIRASSSSDGVVLDYV